MCRSRRSQPGDRVFALDEATGRFVVAPVRAAAQTGVRQTYRVTVGTREIHATDNHPFLVLADDRRGARVGPATPVAGRRSPSCDVGDLVAVPRDLPEFGEVRRFHAGSGFGPATSSPDLLWLLGFFLGDGSTQSAGGRTQFAVVADDRERAGRDRPRSCPSSSALRGDRGRRRPGRRRQPRPGRVAARRRPRRDVADQGGAGVGVRRCRSPQRLAFLGGYVDADGLRRPGAQRLGDPHQRQRRAAVRRRRAGRVSAGSGRRGSSSSRPRTRRTPTGWCTASGCTSPATSSGWTAATRGGPPGSAAGPHHHSATSARGTTFGTHVTEHLGFARVTALEPAEVEPGLRHRGRRSAQLRCRGPGRPQLRGRLPQDPRGPRGEGRHLPRHRHRAARARGRSSASTSAPSSRSATTSSPR